MWYLRSDGSYPDYIGWALLTLCIVVTVGGYSTISGQQMQSNSRDQEQHWQVNAWQVWYFGWLTAVSTGKLWRRQKGGKGRGRRGKEVPCMGCGRGNEIQIVCDSTANIALIAAIVSLVCWWERGLLVLCYSFERYIWAQYHTTLSYKCNTQQQLNISLSSSDWPTIWPTDWLCPHHGLPGLGAVPFFFSEKIPKDMYLGISNGNGGTWDNGRFHGFWLHMKQCVPGSICLLCLTLCLSLSLSVSLALSISVRAFPCPQLLRPAWWYRLPLACFQRAWILHTSLVSESVSEWVSQWVSLWVSLWVSQSVSQWVSESVGDMP